MYPGIHALRTPDKAAAVLVDTGEVLTYRDLDERSIRLSRLFRASGIERGDNIAVVSENSLRYWEIYWAALRSGVYFTAINHHLTPAEVAYILEDCDAKALFASVQTAGLAAAAADLVPTVATRFVFGGDADGFASYDDALAAHPAERLDDERRGIDMLYSSGTTGQPKGVKAPLPPARIDEAPDLFTAVFGPTLTITDETRYLSPAPLYHAAPIRLGGVVQANGGTVFVMSKFDAMRSLQLIEQERITHSQWVPTMFVRLLKLPEEVRRAFDHSHLVCALHAAAPCPPEVKQQMMDWWGPVLWEYYAATEANGITMVAPPQWLAKPGTVGAAALGILHICDESGAELPVGETGIVYFERDELPFRYHKDDAKTAQAQHPDHPTWTTTGDMGRVDEDGFLFLADRQTFVIISGGVNIYPQEIESAYALHPAVADIAVVGVPDDEMGQRARAYVQLDEGVAGSPALVDDLIAFGRERLAGFKVPRDVVFVEALPRTEAGKLLKRKIDPQPAPTR